MQRLKILGALFVLVIALLLLGNEHNDVLEIHESAANMCLSCIGLD